MAATLRLDSSIYSVEVVQKAAYSLIDRLVVLISAAENDVLCDIEPVSGKETDFDKSIQDLKRELLDHSLRERIKSETTAVRNLVLAYTFSRVRLQG